MKAVLITNKRLEEVTSPEPPGAAPFAREERTILAGLHPPHLLGNTWTMSRKILESEWECKVWVVCMWSRAGRARACCNVAEGRLF